ncbi:MAG: acetyl-CoA C-acetyltransferase [Cyclobacteriaceae bacterium]
MRNQNNRVAILGSLRIPFVKSFQQYSRTSNQDMLTATLQGLVDKHNLSGQLLGDVAFGAVMQSSFEWNYSREVVLGTTLHPNTPAFNLQRACGTSLETINLIALKISAGQIASGVGGGSDTNSDLPIMFQRKLAWKLIDLNGAKSLGQRIGRFLKINLSDLKPSYPAIFEPRTGLSMGQHTEKMVKEWKVGRAEQDQLAYESHMNAVKAYQEGFYNDLIIPYKTATKDTIVREDTSMEKLAKLKPAFDKSATGTLTAGNSTIFTDGAAAVFLGTEEYAAQNNQEVLAYFADCEAAAVDFVHGAGLLMAPTLAVARLLKRNNLTLQDFDFYEIHEAFAGQVLCTLKAWEDDEYCKKELGLDKALGSIDRSKMNVKGGSVALGHPFGATGARVVGTMAKLLNQKGKGRGLVSVCTAGGMGVAAIIEK